MANIFNNRHVHTLKQDVQGICFFIALIWVVFALDFFLPLEKLGLIPRSAQGLWGIVAMPFLHADLKHIISNSVPLAVTLFLLAGSRANSAAIVTLIAILGGVLLWIFGQEARHIGASALVYGLIAFHVIAGFVERRLTSIAISIGVGLFYSATFLKGIVPFQHGVSWDGHLFGAVAGGLVALVSARSLTHDANKPDDRDTYRSA